MQRRLGERRKLILDPTSAPFSHRSRRSTLYRPRCSRASSRASAGCWPGQPRGWLRAPRPRVAASLAAAPARLLDRMASDGRARLLDPSRGSRPRGRVTRARALDGLGIRVVGREADRAPHQSGERGIEMRRDEERVRVQESDRHSRSTVTHEKDNSSRGIRGIRRTPRKGLSFSRAKRVENSAFVRPAATAP